jgi:uncharacterized protein
VPAPEGGGPRPSRCRTHLRFAPSTVGWCTCCGTTPSYRALGWREPSSGDDAWTGFLLGGVLWAFFPLPDLTAEAAPGRGPTGWSGITLACTAVPGFAAVAAGATPVADATDRSWGGRSAFIADPEGDRWEITRSPWPPHDARARRPAVLGLRRTSASRGRHAVVSSPAAASRDSALDVESAMRTANAGEPAAGQPVSLS